jgi:hypothetical protein
MDLYIHSPIRTQSINLANLNVIHHRQNSLDSTRTSHINVHNLYPATLIIWQCTTVHYNKNEIATVKIINTNYKRFEDRDVNLNINVR